MKNVFEQVSAPNVFEEGSTPPAEGEGSFSREMELVKQEMQTAIKSGDAKLALDVFLRLNEILPNSRGEKSFDYVGVYAKDIMQKAIKAASAESASYEDVKTMVEVYLSLREYFPTSHNGEAFNYAGTYAKDIMRGVINAAKKENVDDAKLARETLNEIRQYLPTENRGKEFDYVGYYEKEINSL
ncbi:MAG: hypothetical protein ACD_7C00260G0002 [uncultured bacterium]|nr:MAG: hypothetical protein ACD_7C00260G0002 [uncultured bacterium]HBR79031.1 hypothetical protein [Candidatus Moranbacteria bacterium]